MSRQIARDDASLSKGYGFISFSNFEASDDAIANMNGQYLMNKEISVQYAYKKDGKGERHGDEAERMLAAQARKHNVQPQAQQLPAQLFNGPAATPMIPEIEPGRGLNGPPAGYMDGRAGAPNAGYHGVPPLQAARAPPPSMQALPNPPSGLPARPPPSIGGYNGPQGFPAPGYNPQQPGAYPMQGGPPPGAPMPPGFGPPPGQGGSMPLGLPQGFGPPPGQLPPGFQQPGYGRTQ